ncbi:hypothetical protein DPMN_060115 [Dreissena polymorpha]|uniref:Ig-like domain-containing protein n=1 Tax=Dreissena polymorpha TaxID=45954 RepID=A0A9D4HFN9_DREPO|nr:hypothetical protein DPMN_060115 [Dreissena polymorpha]
MLSVVPVNGACVMVSPNITVKPTPEPLLDPGQRVDISLKCVGSEKYLSYYIRNNVIWDFKDNNGTFHPITYSFYEAQGNNTQYADLNFKSGRFEFKHDATKDDNYQFILSIHGVKYSDDGEYTCTLMKGSTKTVADMKTVKVTVVHPVDSVILSLYDSRGAKVEVSNASVVAREIKPGKYTAQCQATGSNPAPKIEIKIDGNSIVASDTGYKAIVSGRPSYSGTVRQNITIAALDIDQFFTCEANIPGTYYATKEATIQLKAVIRNITTAEYDMVLDKSEHYYTQPQQDGSAPSEHPYAALSGRESSAYENP